MSLPALVLLLLLETNARNARCRFRKRITAALAKQKEACNLQKQQIQQLRWQIAQLAAASAPKFDTDFDMIPDADQDTKIQDAKTKVTQKNGGDEDSNSIVDPCSVLLKSFVVLLNKQ